MRCETGYMIHDRRARRQNKGDKRQKTRRDRRQEAEKWEKKSCLKMGAEKS